MKWLFVLPGEEAVTIICPGEHGQPEHEGTEWIIGTGIVTLPLACQMRGSSFTIYSRNVFQNQVTVNISSVIRIPKPAKPNFNIQSSNYDKISSIISNITTNYRYTFTSLNNLGAASVRQSTLDSLINQYEPNNYVSYHNHILSLTFVIVWIVIILLLNHYCKLSKLCVKLSKKKRPIPI